MSIEVMKQQPADKPVAWMMTNAMGKPYFRKNPQDKVFNPQPVYTAPIAREWVGLTLVDRSVLLDQWHWDEGTVNDLCLLTEALLKEKNK